MAHVSDAAALIARRLGEDREAAVARADQARDNAKEGRFSRTIFAEDDGA